MNRKIYKDLIEWKKTNDFKPLMILGARQVGKTYIINKFCENEFNNFISINLLERKDIVKLYKENINSDEKYLKLKLLLNEDIEKENTILFIDEIQESEKLISELKYFCEKHSNIRIICAGSLLGVKLKRNKTAFPVGKVTMIKMYPMDFEEFLNAAGEKLLIDEIKNCYENNKQMLESIHHKALELYKVYLISGGMPESVKNIVDVNLDVTKYNKLILNNIIDSYFNDMSKYVKNNSETLKIERTYRSIPSQLNNRSNKFQFSKIITGAKSKHYETALDWLKASNIISASYQVSTPEIPLKAFIKEDYFKLFLNDVGLLSNILELNYKDIIMDNLSLYKGPITENYVANQLTANGYSLYYWQSNATSEIDFIIYNEDGNIPIEVKASDNVRSKSLNIYIEKFKPPYAIRISTRNFGMDYNKKIKSVPLYAVFCINNNN